MVKAAPDILARVASAKQAELPLATARRGDLERLAAARASDRRDFRRALESKPRAIIAEFKKASPSKGTIAADRDPRSVAAAYELGGAACMSVLTDREFFGGSLDDLEAARSSVRLPVLRKDFTLDPIHVIEAAAHGADAILLIAALLSEQDLRSLRELAENYGMAALVEVHDEDELNVALASGATLVGVNNRNLRTFEVTLDTSVRLAEPMPSDILRVAESGIDGRPAIERLEAAGYHAFLIGEHLMRSGDPAAALRELLA